MTLTRVFGCRLCPTPRLWHTVIFDRGDLVPFEIVRESRGRRETQGVSNLLPRFMGRGKQPTRHFEYYVSPQVSESNASGGERTLDGVPRDSQAGRDIAELAHRFECKLFSYSAE